MRFTVKDIASWVQGEVIGNGDTPITAARPLTDARAGDVTFVEDKTYHSAWESSAAAAAIVPPSMPAGPKPMIRVADPLMAFVSVIRQLRGQALPSPPRIDPSAHVHPSAIIAAGVTVGPFAVVGEGSMIGARTTLQAGVVVGSHCSIGEDCILHPNAVLYDDCVLGDRTIIHANTVIGSDGFGYRMSAGKHVKVPQLGSVEIGDDVEIGACSTIDRGTFSATRIGSGTKLDNLVQVAHNVNIGKHNVLCSQVGIAGSVVTGDYVVLAGQVGVVDHVKIGNQVTAGAKTGIHADVPDGKRMLGFPSTQYHEQLRMMAALRKLPKLLAEVKRLRAHLGLEEPVATPPTKEPKAAA